jgi:hypothetical protein
VVRGLIYRFRYRVYNINGWSAYSDVAYLFAFQAPAAPPRPTFISATDTSVTLGLQQSLDDRGVPIQTYELWIDEADDASSTFTQITSFTNFSPTYTLTSADGLGAPGTIYRVKLRAVNEEGT